MAWILYDFQVKRVLLNSINIGPIGYSGFKKYEEGM